MRNWERTLLIATAAALAALLARTTLAPEARADADRQEHPIAVCAIPSIVNQLMQSERFAPVRENLLPDVRDRLRDIREEMQDIREDLEGASPDDPDAQASARQFRTLSRELAELQQQLVNAVERKTAEQIAECFALARSSASAVAEDLGFDYVISTGDPDEDLNTDATEVTLRQITARPVVKFPRGVDITDDVRDDLHID